MDIYIYMIVWIYIYIYIYILYIHTYACMHIYIYGYMGLHENYVNRFRPWVNPHFPQETVSEKGVPYLSHFQTHSNVVQPNSPIDWTKSTDRLDRSLEPS